MIDNGRRVRLVIDGVYDGGAGEAGGVVAFVPPRKVRRPGNVRAGTIDGAPVTLEWLGDAAGPFLSFRWSWGARA